MTETWQKEHQGQRRTRTAPWYRSRYSLELHGGVHPRANMYFLKELKYMEKNCRRELQLMKKKPCWNRETVWKERISIEKPLCNYHKNSAFLYYFVGRQRSWLRVKDESWNCERMKEICSFCVFLCFSQLESNTLGKKIFFSQVCFTCDGNCCRISMSLSQSTGFLTLFLSLPTPPPAE